VEVDDATLEAWQNQLADWEESRRAGNPELFDALDHCLRRLPAAMSEAINRFYYQEQAADTIAAALGIDAAALRKRLQRAREALRACINRKLPNPA
jgi:RNA polymerase sigma-70 factor (ECF subfamily)